MCSLDRSCGKDSGNAVATTALVQAVKNALRLPSRFPTGVANNRRGVYFQAAKVGYRENATTILRVSLLVKANDMSQEEGFSGYGIGMSGYSAQSRLLHKNGHFDGEDVL